MLSFAESAETKGVAILAEPFPDVMTNTTVRRQRTSQILKQRANSLCMLGLASLVIFRLLFFHWEAALNHGNICCTTRFGNMQYDCMTLGKICRNKDTQLWFQTVAALSESPSLVWRGRFRFLRQISASRYPSGGMICTVAQPQAESLLPRSVTLASNQILPLLGISVLLP